MANLLLLGLIILVGVWIISFLTGDDKLKHSKDQKEVPQRKEEYKFDISIDLPGETLFAQLKVPFPDSEFVVRSCEIFAALRVGERPSYEIEKKEVVRDV